MKEKSKEIQFLRTLPLFSGCSEQTLVIVTVSPLFEKKEYKKGEKVAHIGGALGVLHQGKLKVGGRQDRKKLVLNRMMPGVTFGFSTLFEKQGHFETDISAECRTEVWWIPEELVAQILKTDGVFAQNIIAIQSEKIRFLNLKILSYTAATAKDKLLLFLRELPSVENGLTSLPCDMAGLAARLDMSRATLYRAFAALEEEGIVEKIGDMIKVKY